jgi:hypothetical protein
VHRRRAAQVLCRAISGKKIGDQNDGSLVPAPSTVKAAAAKEQHEKDDYQDRGGAHG